MVGLVAVRGQGDSRGSPNGDDYAQILHKSIN